MKKHDRKTTLNYFCDDVVVLNNGAVYRILALGQSVLPQEHSYKAKNMITGNYARIVDGDIHDKETEKLNSNNDTMSGVFMAERALLDTPTKLIFGEYEKLKLEVE